MTQVDILEHIRKDNIVLVEHRGMRFIDFIDMWDDKFNFRRTDNNLEANIKAYNNNQWITVGQFKTNQ